MQTRQAASINISVNNVVKKTIKLSDLLIKPARVSYCFGHLSCLLRKNWFSKLINQRFGFRDSSVKQRTPRATSAWKFIWDRSVGQNFEKTHQQTSVGCGWLMNNKKKALQLFCGSFVVNFTMPEFKTERNSWRKVSFTRKVNLLLLNEDYNIFQKE